MTKSLKVLGQAAPSVATPTDLYTVPVATMTESFINICNQSASPTSFRVSVRVGGTSDSPEQYVYFDEAIAANETFSASLDMTLSAGDVVTVYATDATLSFNLFGFEYTNQLLVDNVLQRVSFQTGSMTTGTTLIPVDNSKPQNNEGDEYMTLSITPKSAVSKLRIDANAYVSSNGASGTLMVMALFKDSDADALATAMGVVTGLTSPIPLIHTMDSGATSPITFKIRIGGGSSNTLTFNGIGGSAFFDGTLVSGITITEYES